MGHSDNRERAAPPHPPPPLRSLGVGGRSRPLRFLASPLQPQHIAVSLACFWAGWGFRIAGTVLPLASLAVRRSPLARAAKNGQFWPVFGLFWPVFGLFLRCAATVVSGAKCQPSQHPGTPRVAQGWMGLSYSRDGAASRFARCSPLTARSLSQKWPVLARFWAVLASFWPVLALRGDRRERSKTSAISAPWNPPGGTGLDGAFV